MHEFKILYIYYYELILIIYFLLFWVYLELISETNITFILLLWR
jgi:hypothetical protein